MKNLLVKIPLTYRPFILPVVVLLTILGMTVSGGQFLWGKIAEERQKIGELKNKNTLLETKKTVLSSQDKNQLLKYSQTAVDAIPGETPTLAALASTNNLAFDNQLTLSDFRVNEKKEGGTSSSELTVNTEGSLANTITFLNQLKNSAPLSKVVGLVASVQGGVARTKTTLLSLWAPLPTSIGKTETAVQPLTSAESEIAERLSNLEQPGGGFQEASPAQGRTNPFTR